VCSNFSSDDSLLRPELEEEGYKKDLDAGKMARRLGYASVM
jgi:hypothetical protein